MTSSEITSRPKNLVRETAAAASVPSSSATAVAIEATLTESVAVEMSSQAT
jgi:hypothetical protein